MRFIRIAATIICMPVLLSLLIGPVHATTSSSRVVLTFPDTTTAPVWDPEGLAAQPRLHDLRTQVPDGLDWVPDTTAWHSDAQEIPAALAVSADNRPETAGATLLKLAAALELGDALGQDTWEHTLRVSQHSEERAIGVILQWGFKDGSVAGQDLRVLLLRTDDGWYVDRIDERYYCRRGVHNNQCV